MIVARPSHRWKFRSVLILFASLAAFSQVQADEVPLERILLWPNGAPGAVGDEPEDKPQLEILIPPEDRRTGTGVVVCPGGGYGGLATDHEGRQAAQWLNSIGVAGFVLKYRHAPRYRHPAPLQDAQRAIRYVRANAQRWGLSPDRIGIMGFSAGGHLASTAATRFEDGQADSDDPVARVSSRPDFAILAYPVISFTADFAHRGSVRNLLGDDPDPELLKSLSNETQVTGKTPPTFLFHTAEDPVVPVQNSLAFYEALCRAGVPAELHVYQFGPHGVGLGVADPALASWPERLAAWLKTSGFLSDVKRMPVEGMVMLDGKPLRWGSITFLPMDAPRAPAAFALISQGRFKVPASRGAAVGRNRVVVRNLGGFKPHATIEAVKTYAAGLTLEVVPDAQNEITLKLEESGFRD